MMGRQVHHQKKQKQQYTTRSTTSVMRWIQTVSVLALVLCPSFVDSFVVPPAALLVAPPPPPPTCPSRHSSRVQRPQWAMTMTDSSSVEEVVEDASNKESIDELEQNLSRFRGYLNWIGKNTRSKQQTAKQMDRELRVMEERSSSTETPATKGRYHGPTIHPDQACYGVVAEAFAKANLGVEGAEMAANILNRCQIHSNNNAGIVLYTSVMKAWALADAFDKARQILSDLEERHTVDGALAPDMIAYTVYLNVLSDTKSKTGKQIATEALQLLGEMHAKADSGENVKVRPNTYTYTAVMKCLARAKDYAGIRALFDDLKKRLEEAPEDEKDNYRPGKLVYGTMIGLYAESDLGNEGADRADALLKELQEQFQETKNILYRPNPFIYASVLLAHSRVTNKEHLDNAVKRVDEILKQCKQDKHLALDTTILEAAMKVKSHRNLPNGAQDAELILRSVAAPSANMYQTAIFAYATRNRPVRAQHLLYEMKKLKRDGKVKNPSIATMIACIRAWIRNGGETAAPNADRLLRRVVQLQVERHHKGRHHRQGEIEPRLFNDQIVAWRRTGRKDAGERGEAILNLMDDALQKTGNKVFATTNYTFHSTIEAWGNSSHPRSGERALGLLKRMGSIKGRENIAAPNTVLYPVMKALVRSGNATLIGATNDVYSKMCENYIDGDRSFTLTGKTNTMFLRDFASNPDALAGVRAENLLRHMEEMSAKEELRHLTPCQYEYNCVINVYAKKGEIEEAERLIQEMGARSKNGEESIQVSATTYSVLIAALIERGLPSDEERVDFLLKKILNGHRDGIQSLRPDSTFFTSFLFSLAQKEKKDPILVKRGFSLLKQKRRFGFLPNDTDYGILCKLVLNHGSVEDIESLRVMLMATEANGDRRRERPLHKSIYVQYMTTCMYHEDAGAKQKGKEMLQHIAERVATGKSQLTLDRHLYHVLLSGWARSHHQDAFRETVQLFETMKASENADVQPVIRSYNWVLFAAGRTPTATEQEARAQFETAMSIFTETHQSGRAHADALTYSNFLFVCATLLPPGEGQDKIARNVITLCQKRGMMSRLVYENVSRYFPILLEAIEKEEGIRKGSIPNSWQRSVAPTSRYRSSTPRKVKPPRRVTRRTRSAP